MTSQLGLIFNDSFANAEQYDQILGAIKGIVARVTLKQVAHDRDQSPSVINHALDRRDRHYLRADWLPYFLDRDQGGELARLLVGKRYDLSPKKELEPSEKPERLLEVVEGELGESVAGVLLKKAGLK